jgi:hypothetical protein
MAEFEEQYAKVTETLLEYGWVLTPFLINRDFIKIQILVSTIDKNTSLTEIERDKFQREINILLTDIIFNPLFRAFFVYRAKEVKYIQDFSHHMERALLHYYNNDYFSTVLCLLPAIEGSLLAYYGWELGTIRKPSITKLIQEIEKCRIRTYDTVKYKMYSKYISLFLQKWIFSDTSTTDTTFSYLNRHYVLHGMGNNNYYSIADAHRLIMFFDLFIEFISLEQRINYNFIPDPGVNISIDSRSHYYFKLLTSEIKRKEVMITEYEFMKQNINYYVEKDIPNFKEMLIHSSKEHTQFMKDMKSKFGHVKKNYYRSFYKRIKHYFTRR